MTFSLQHPEITHFSTGNGLAYNFRFSKQKSKIIEKIRLVEQRSLSHETKEKLEAQKKKSNTNEHLATQRLTKIDRNFEGKKKFKVYIIVPLD